MNDTAAKIVQPVRAVMIDPVNLTVQYVPIDLYTPKGALDDGMLSIQEWLDCDYFESAPSLFADTTTLVAEIHSMRGSVDSTFRMPNDIMGTITGRMLIVGVGRQGEMVDCVCPLDNIVGRISPDMEIVDNYDQLLHLTLEGRRKV